MGRARPAPRLFDRHRRHRQAAASGRREALHRLRALAGRAEDHAQLEPHLGPERRAARPAAPDRGSEAPRRQARVGRGLQPLQQRVSQVFPLSSREDHRRPRDPPPRVDPRRRPGDEPERRARAGPDGAPPPRASTPAEGQVTSRSGVRESRTTALVRVETDSGIHGFGSCSGNGAIVQFIIEQVVKPAVVGMDPTDIDRIWQKLYFGPRARQLGLRGIGFVALSGLDVALWDIRGKAEGAPIYKLLSDKPRARVEVYATALYPDDIKKVVERALALAELGYRGIKMKIGFDVAGDIERVRAVREAVGAKFPLMSDAHMGYDLPTAERAAP